MIPFYYGCLIIGPSGSGKTTLCKGLSQLFQQIERPYITINLDPANEVNDDFFTINLKELITLEDVMKELNLGPNAALLYCMNFLEKNLDWLMEKILNYRDSYLIFDFPVGQIELYLNNDSLKEIISKLTSQKNEKLQIQVTAVELFDCINLYDDNSYIAQCLMSLISQINLELPHVNVMNKLDLLKEFGSPPMSLLYYLEASELQYIFDIGLKQDYENKILEGNQDKLTEFKKKTKRLSYRLAEFIDTQGKVSFFPLYVENKELVVRLLLQIDLGNGYYYLEKLSDKYKSLQQLYQDEELLSTDLMSQLESELFEDEL